MSAWPDFWGGCLGTRMPVSMPCSWAPHTLWGVGRRGGKLDYSSAPDPKGHVPEKPLETAVESARKGLHSTALHPSLTGAERSVWRMGEEKADRIGSRAPRSELPSRWRLHITACLAPLSTRLPSQGSRQLKKDKIKRSNSPALTSARGLNSPAAA